MSALTAYHLVSGSTLNIVFKVQGSAGQSGVWSDLTAATTGSTAGTVYNSTATLTFDKARFQVTANAWTSTSTTGLLAVTLLARP